MRAGECWIFDTWRMHNVVNDHALPRIHLVADTVGGIGFWQLVARARPHARVSGDWQPAFVPPDPRLAAVARFRIRERAGGDDALGVAGTYRVRTQ